MYLLLAVHERRWGNPAYLHVVAQTTQATSAPGTAFPAATEPPK